MSLKTNRYFLAHLAAFAVALIYGANYSIGKIAMDNENLHPLGIVWLRILTGTILFSAIYFLFLREKVYRSDLPLFILCAFTGVAFNMSFFFLGLHYTNPINASLVMTTSPILVLIFSYLIVRERITWVKVFGIFIALLGALFLIYRPGQLFSLQSIKGDLMIFLNASSYSLYLVLVKKLIVKYNPFTILAVIFSIGLIMVMPLAYIYVQQINWSTVGSAEYWSLGFILVATTCLAYLLNAFALKTVKSSTVGTYIYLQPLLATIFAILLQKDQVSLKMLVAASLIFTGLYLVSKKN